MAKKTQFNVSFEDPGIFKGEEIYEATDLEDAKRQCREEYDFDIDEDDTGYTRITKVEMKLDSGGWIVVEREGNPEHDLDMETEEKLAKQLGKFLGIENCSFEATEYEKGYFDGDGGTMNFELSSNGKSILRFFTSCTDALFDTRVLTEKFDTPEVTAFLDNILRDVNLASEDWVSEEHRREYSFDNVTDDEEE